MTSDPTIDYEALTQDAMRGVVRTVLTGVAKNGLPGDHHFYISFDTDHPGVTLSKRLRERYAQGMTIVLQHRFWDLAVHEDRFEVKLTFDGIPERLVVPLAAIKVFFDPSVRYGLQFDEPDTETDPEAVATGDGDIETRVTATRRSSGAPKSGTSRKRRTPKSDPAKDDATAPADSESVVSEESAGEAEADKPQSATVVSLDQFRKK